MSGALEYDSEAPDSFRGSNTAVFLYLPILLRRYPRLLLEEGAEIGCIREIEVVGNLLDALLGILEQGNAFAYNGLENQFLDCVSADGFGEDGKIFGRKAEFVCIELYAALFGIMLVDELNQADEDVVLMADGGLQVHELAVVDGTDAVGQSQEQQLLFVAVEGVVFHLKGAVQQGHVFQYFFFVAGVPHIARLCAEAGVEVHGGDGIADDVAYRLYLVDKDE